MYFKRVGQNIVINLLYFIIDFLNNFIVIAKRINRKIIVIVVNVINL